jgi:hypothetical protein
MEPSRGQGEGLSQVRAHVATTSSLAEVFVWVLTHHPMRVTKRPSRGRAPRARAALFFLSNVAATVNVAAVVARETGRRGGAGRSRCSGRGCR